MKSWAPLTAIELSLAFLTLAGADRQTDGGTALLPVRLPVVVKDISYPDTMLSPFLFSFLVVSLVWLLMVLFFLLTVVVVLDGLVVVVVAGSVVSLFVVVVFVLFCLVE